MAQSEFFVEDPRDTGSGIKDQDFFQKIIEDKFLRDLTWEINFKSAQICKKWADRVANDCGEKKYVAGSVGPLTVSLSQSPDADDAAFRMVSFNQVVAAYSHQIEALIEGGSDPVSYTHLTLPTN